MHMHMHMRLHARMHIKAHMKCTMYQLHTETRACTHMKHMKRARAHTHTHTLAYSLFKKLRYARTHHAHPRTHHTHTHTHMHTPRMQVPRGARMQAPMWGLPAGEVFHNAGCCSCAAPTRRTATHSSGALEHEPQGECIFAQFAESFPRCSSSAAPARRTATHSSGARETGGNPADCC